MDSKIIENLNLKPIPNWPGYYASKCGEIISVKRMEKNGRGGNRKTRILSKVENRGYWRTTVWTTSKKLSTGTHRLVALAWLPNPHKLPEVNHINGCKKDNRVENLEWVSPSQNRFHQYSYKYDMQIKKLEKEVAFWKRKAKRCEAFLRVHNQWEEEA